MPEQTSQPANVEKYRQLEADVAEVGEEAQRRGLIGENIKFFGVAKTVDLPNGERGHAVVSAPRADGDETVAIRVVSEKTQHNFDADETPREYFSARGGEVVASGVVASSNARAEETLSRVLGEDVQQPGSKMSGSTLDKLDELAVGADEYAVQNPDGSVAFRPLSDLYPENSQTPPSAVA